MSDGERRNRMAPLNEPSSWCIRSFEVVPELLPLLRKQGQAMRRDGLNVRFIEGALANKSGRVERSIVRYSNNADGLSATALRFEDVHVEGRPKARTSQLVQVSSYDVREVVQSAFRNDPSVIVALKLDVEGDEWWMLKLLSAELSLLCSLSFIFVEFHSSATDVQRAKLEKYGLGADLFDQLKTRIHHAMDQPGCRLQIYWRSFWASCGDKQRFEWRDSPQATSSTSQWSNTANLELATGPQ
eukprot:CAMPEP_0119307458 /NCGR_PEP_ID=MMETSP1333-20130426/7952_1 /TAXON_ID=418940 /ORGANISM="Scyphosphaera apsteinii, Strain RCC1455" /LENGTH=242 /DNA_ID=CAMNT_0007311009 /DNA_START=480 /DNA_END=1208 /DNA_ORIENTATION=+